MAKKWACQYCGKDVAGLLGIGDGFQVSCPHCGVAGPVEKTKALATTAWNLVQSMFVKANHLTYIVAAYKRIPKI